MRALFVMPQFKKKISIPHDGTFTFLFTLIYTVNGVRYFVSVFDESLILHNFRMQNPDDCGWRISDSNDVPDWIIDVEKELGLAILNQ